MRSYIKTIDKQTYINIIKSNQLLKTLKDIDFDQYSDYYYLLYTVNENLAVCGIHDQKHDIRQVNGLVSFKKGSGAELLNSITAKHLRLNCTQELYNRFYSKLGFKICLKIDNYLEVIKHDC